MSFVNIKMFVDDFENNNAFYNKSSFYNEKVASTVMKLVDKSTVNCQTDCAYIINTSFSRLSRKINSATITDFIASYISYTYAHISAELEGIYETASTVTLNALTNYQLSKYKAIPSRDYYAVFSNIPEKYEFIQSNNMADKMSKTNCFTLKPGQVKLDVDTPIYKLEKFKQITLQAKLCISCEKPDIGDILGQKVSVNIKDMYIINTPKGTSYEGQKLTGYKLMVYGEIELVMEYTTCGRSKGVHAAHLVLPFGTFIIIPEEEKDDQFDVVAIVEDAYQQILDCRCTLATIMLLLSANNY